MIASRGSDQSSGEFGIADARALHGSLVSARERSLQRERAWTIRFERTFIAAGVLGLLVCVATSAQMLMARRWAGEIAGNRAAKAASSGPSAAPGEGPGGEVSPAVVGRVEIPAIGMVTPLLAGDDSMSLTEGAGHIPGTAYPGGLGTVGIAGHRDTHFRLLSRVAKGMDVRLIDQKGTYHYRVTSSEIVTPEQVSVLDILSRPGLALVTCYPFHYVGSAPKRFVVHAALVSAAPDEPAAAGR